MKIVSSAAVVVASLLFVQQALAQTNPEPPKSGRVFHAGSGAPNHLVQKRRLAEQRANSFDQGDFYLTPGGKHELHRLADSVVLRFNDTAAKTNALASLTVAGGALSGYETDFETSQGWVVLRQNSVRGKILQSGLAPTAQAITAARGGQGVRAARPLFIDPPSGLWMIPTDEIIVRLKPGVDPQDYFGANWSKARPVGGTTDQFVLTLPDMTAEEMLAETQRHAGDARMVWCQPDFISQEVSQVNDTLYPLQWPLNNTGQTGAKTNADINAAEAWLTTTGSTNIVIAVLDDAVQTAHPDLSANIFHNTADPIDGLDNDGNGYTNDFTGWDFLGNDNDPNPVLTDDNHGTAVAGLAAAVGNNNLGVAGVAYTCKILPVKGFNISNSARAESFYYAAGRARNGVGTWRGADIINYSFSSVQSLVVDDALHWAATSGRGGKGCAIFVSSGNVASDWFPDFVTISSADKHTIKWEYAKDNLNSVCDDTAWLDSVMFTDGTVESFESGGLPSGWTTGGDANWSNVQDGVSGNHALTGWSGPGSRALRAGTIGNFQITYVDVTRNLPAGDVWFWYWVSSQDGFDSLNIYLDGVFQYPLSGCVPQTTAVAYPASHPDVIGVGASTDFDYRADFSQYGTNLSLVAPGGGGRGGIYTTDRTGTDGYNSGDYDSGFAGTSAASPIAAGVGALVLSVNPALTAKEVRKILQDSCDKIGGVTYTNGWHPYYGYGRVNAQAALALALPKITSARITTNDVRIRFNSLTNRVYQLQRRDSLNASSAWINVSSATNVVGNGVEAEAVDAGGYSQNTRFYRVRQLP